MQYIYLYGLLFSSKFTLISLQNAFSRSLLFTKILLRNVFGTLIGYHAGGKTKFSKCFSVDTAPSKLIYSISFRETLKINFTDVTLPKIVRSLLRRRLFGRLPCQLFLLSVCHLIVSLPFTSLFSKGPHQCWIVRQANELWNIYSALIGSEFIVHRFWKVLDIDVFESSSDIRLVASQDIVANSFYILV